VAEEAVRVRSNPIKHNGRHSHVTIRYNEIFFMIDTCQATTMYTQFYSPNILATGSSSIGENSYSVCSIPVWGGFIWLSRHSHSTCVQYENDASLGVAVIDSFTHLVLSYFEGINKTSQATMQELFDAYDPVPIKSNPGIRSDLFQRSPSKTLLTDFFGGVAQAAPISPAEVEASYKLAAVRSKEGTEKHEQREKERQEKRKGRGVSFGWKKKEVEVKEESKEAVKENVIDEMKQEEVDVHAQVQNAANVQVPTKAPFDFKLGMDAPVRAWAGVVAVAGWLVLTSFSR
jgi:glycosylphosphatidylinositol transamidase (GPIT) subunit GPI8